MKQKPENNFICRISQEIIESISGQIAYGFGATPPEAHHEATKMFRKNKSKFRNPNQKLIVSTDKI